MRFNHKPTITRIFLSVIFLIIGTISYSQNKKIFGNIWHAETHAPLPYVNIGIKDKTVGTVSDNEGKFELLLNDKVTPKDTVYFSYIGFNTEKYLVSELYEIKKPILLQPKNTELDEVVISSEKIKLKPKNIGKTSKGLGLMHSNFYTAYEIDVDDRLSRERDMKLNVRRNCHIKSLNFYISNNQFKHIKFRVNFYEVENGLPTGLIIQDNIIFDVKDNFSEWFKVDLEPYGIYFNEDNKTIAVTLQWLESVQEDKKRNIFTISAALSPLHTAFSRDKAMDIWSKGEYNLSFYLNAMCE